MPYLNPVPGSKIALQATWFKSVRDRIEEIKPLQGNYIIIQQTSEGEIVSVDFDKLKNALVGDSFLTEYTLNVCKNGAPGTLIVYGPSGQEA
jgi:hypothetical protein